MSLPVALRSSAVSEGPVLRGERVLLRRWRPQDRDPFAALNADPVVMEHFPATLTRAQSDALVDRVEALFELNGYGLWALEVPGLTPFAGFVGLVEQTFPAHFTPAVEIGWRLSADWWHQGFATEAAGLALAYGFESIGLSEIVSMTSTTNLASQAVMRRIGMHRDPADDFDHPSVPPDSVIRRHVLYRLGLDEWRESRRAGGAGDQDRAS